MPNLNVNLSIEEWLMVGVALIVAWILMSKGGVQLYKVLALMTGVFLTMAVMLKGGGLPW